MHRGDADAVMGLIRMHIDAFRREVTLLNRDASQLRGDVFITDEVLARGAHETLAVVLHEAAHTVADHRGITDTSSHGRYHNGRFRRVAEELGLQAEARNPSNGWSLKKLAPETETRYTRPVARLAAVLGDYTVIASTDRDPTAPMVLKCDCGIFHRGARRRALPARGVVCSTCRTASRAAA
jgi:hypothetical protein